MLKCFYPGLQRRKNNFIQGFNDGKMLLSSGTKIKKQFYPVIQRLKTILSRDTKIKRNQFYPGIQNLKKHFIQGCKD